MKSEFTAKVLAQIGSWILGKVDSLSDEGQRKSTTHYYRRGVRRFPGCPQSFNWCGEFWGKQSNDWGKVDCDACLSLRALEAQDSELAKLG